jgi:hypothetical protein
MINVLLPTAASPQKTILNIRLKGKIKIKIKIECIIYSNNKSCCMSTIVDPSVRFVAGERVIEGEFFGDCVLLAPRFKNRR